MKSSPPQKGGNRSRTTTLVFLAVGCVLLAAALFIGIGDNPPGLALVYLAVCALILAFAHRWRRVRSFLILLGVCLSGFPLFAVLHNVFYGLGEMASELVVLRSVLGFLEAVFFLVAILVCPPGVLIGAVGSVVLAVSHFIRERTSDKSS
jgi:hypothetical protein